MPGTDFKLFTLGRLAAGVIGALLGLAIALGLTFTLEPEGPLLYIALTAGGAAVGLVLGDAGLNALKKVINWIASIWSPG